MRKFIYLSIFYLLLVLTGCTRPPQEKYNLLDYLPPKTTNIQHIDDHWFTFEVALEDGKKKKFICYRREYEPTAFVELRN